MTRTDDATAVRCGLSAAYDLVIFDLDGVIYLIDRPIRGAVEAVDRLRRAGLPVAYATNNASRRSADVAGLLRGMGVPATTDEVVTSAGATAALLAQQYGPGARALVVGADALRDELTEAGLALVASADDKPAVVVQGYGPGIGWADLAEASVAIRGGADWVATNTDRTLPSARGPLPGNGSLVAALRTALNREPDQVVGKPEPGLFVSTARRAGADRPLVVGDRLDTDIEGANRAGMASLLVLTGISDARELLAAPPARRPTYLAADLAGLFAADAARPIDDDPTEDAGWQVHRHGSAGLVLGGTGGDSVQALRVLCRHVWQGAPVTEVRSGSAAAESALRDLALA
ncbi:HAD superfamily hydrolase (TIGR01450 family) [Micromonospora sp. Llam0]|uniref:HAD-IIA family hydrolase n=1 Tax=Micromonospora sp. Llam0 TaxID=2485143 RepID=UPI000F4821DA|nr:HAD-IIA family hydrolase [Micromonospora sp. Llam0]ROO59700.1 HAD superfamily hydrolase (TIGR01450 family) [Micromonospora sp. Llam0]